MAAAEISISVLRILSSSSRQIEDENNQFFAKNGEGCVLRGYVNVSYDSL